MDNTFYTELLQMLKEGYAFKTGIYRKLSDEDYIEALKKLDKGTVK